MASKGFLMPSLYIPAGGRAGKAVLLPGKYNVSTLQMIVVYTSFTYYEFLKDKIYVHIQLCP